MSGVRTLNIGLCGLGTVGQGVWKHFERQRPELEARLGVKIVLQGSRIESLHGPGLLPA